MPSPPPSPADRSAVGFGPTPDPSRSGALWVGGAGVALLLAAAAVLTAVRWDDIGQSAKLGGLVAITLGLLFAGQRFKQTIPMTAQAIFHLGALLIPFDMAAVAVLAGRSWQETLLLTSVTSVMAWYGIEQAAPSILLKWSARSGVVALAAGVAAVSPIAMPVALAAAAVVAVVGRKATAAALWAGLAAALPLAAFVDWPHRIAGAMDDLGFDALDRWQPLAAGALATIVLVGVTRLAPRIELAWAAVTAAVLTAVLALGGFDDAHITYVAIAALFLALETFALIARSDKLWKPIAEVTALVGELVASTATLVLLGIAIYPEGFNFGLAATTIAMSGVLFALGWLMADTRRVEADSLRRDWLTSLAMGSNYPVTTAGFPAAVLAAAVGFDARPVVLALVSLGLSYWMIATWRSGAAYGSLVLAAVAVVTAASTSPWIELALGGGVAAMLMLAARLRLRAKDHVAAIVTSFGAISAWLLASDSFVNGFPNHWPLAIVIGGAWALSWIAEVHQHNADPHVAHWLGRLTAGVVLVSSLWVAPLVGLSLCILVAALAGIDYVVATRTIAPSRTWRMQLFASAAGASFGLAGMALGELAGLAPTTAGAALTVAGFVAAGFALALPRAFEWLLGAVAVVSSTLGLIMTFPEPTMFALALIAVGCTTMFVAAALRNLAVGVGGYVVVALGVALELAALDVIWLEPYLVMPTIAALAVGWRFHRAGGSSWVAFAPTIALFAYVAIAERFAGGSAWHAVIAGTVGVLAIIGGGYRRLAGPLITGSAILAIVVGYESLGPAALVPTWAWLAAGGTVLLAAGVAMERTDTSPLERGEQLRNVIATQFS